MSCYNCNDRGGTMVRGRDGESDFDPCNECDAFHIQVKEQERCSKAREAIRQLGLNVFVSRRQVIILVDDQRMECSPTKNGGWTILQTRSDAPRIPVNQVLSIQAALFTS